MACIFVSLSFALFVSFICFIRSHTRIHTLFSLFFTNNHIFYVNLTKKKKLTTIIDTQRTHTLIYTTTTKNNINWYNTRWAKRVMWKKKLWWWWKWWSLRSLRLVQRFLFGIFSAVRRIYTHTHTFLPCLFISLLICLSLSLSISPSLRMFFVGWLLVSQSSTKTYS